MIVTFCMKQIFLLSKIGGSIFFLTDFLNFFFILQSPEQTWVACPMFLCRLLNPGFFSTTIVYNLTIRHFFKLERSLWPSFSRFWARKCDFFEKTQKNCNLDCKHSSCNFLTSVQALALYSSGNVLYIMLFELSYFTWRYNLI